MFDRRKDVFVVLVLIVQFAFVRMGFSDENTSELMLMPWPQEVEQGEGQLILSESIEVHFPNYHSERLQHNVNRLINQWEQLGNKGSAASVGNKVQIQIRVNHKAPNHESILQSDESYHLDINQKGVVLTASEPLGAMQGMQTLSQLMQVSDEGVATLPYISIDDRPRFKWRGVLLDSARHFIPLDVIKRQLDGMASAKMNVLHWHLTDDQGWRIESNLYPKLHQLGSDGLYYSQEEIRELVAYAYDLGIRVVPEVDMPGHASAIAAAYPEFISSPGPYEIERQWGIHKPTLNPVDEEVYQFIDGLLKELSGLFPDPYFHIGGDEVDPHQWNENKAIQTFIQRNELTDYKGMQAYFNQRVENILGVYDKKMIGWDEIFHPSLSKDIVIQSWRGHDSLNQVVREGRQGILSTGFYIDQPQPTDYHYRNDPNPEVTPTLTDLKSNEHWQSWSFTMPRLRGSAVTGHFTLITDEQEKARGFIDFTGRSRKVLSNVEIVGKEVRFSVDTWMGAFSPVISMKGKEFTGYGLVANGHYSISGKQVGGTDIKGSKLVDGVINPALSYEEQNRILGAEATLWGENVVADVMDLRLWPRTYAIAERLWSARGVDNVEWMYQRLGKVSVWSERAIGLQHNAQSRRGMQRLARSQDIEPLMILAEAVEQAQYYHRHHVRAKADNYHQASLLDNFVDTLPVENLTTRRLSQMIDTWLSDPTNTSNEQAISSFFERWLSNETRLNKLLETNPKLAAIGPSVDSVAQVSALGLSLIKVIKGKNKMTLDKERKAQNILIDAMQIKAETVVSAAYSVEKLFRYVYE